MLTFAHICSSNKQVKMNNLFVTRKFLETDSCVQAYKNATEDSWTYPLGGAFAAWCLSAFSIRLLIMMVTPNFTAFSVIVWSGTFSLIGAAVGRYVFARQRETRRLRAVRRSIFGQTLDELYGLYRQVDRYVDGISGDERDSRVREITTTMENVWRESHQLLGLVIGEAPSLERAQELLQEFRATKEAIKELQNS